MAEIKLTRIYVLRDPHSNTIRYVGKTIETLKRRLANHVASAKRGNKTHCAAWIRRLLSIGGAPVIELIEECGEAWPDREKHWIQVYGSLGSLTNHALGGQGVPGVKRSASAVRKIAEATRKSWQNPVVRAARLVNMIAADRPPQTQEQIQKSRIRHGLPEVRAHLSAKMREKWNDPTYRSHIAEKVREHNLSREWTEEERKKVGQKSRASWTPQRRSEYATRMSAQRREQAESGWKQSVSEKQRTSQSEKMKAIRAARKGDWKQSVMSPQAREQASLRMKAMRAAQREKRRLAENGPELPECDTQPGP